MQLQKVQVQEDLASRQASGLRLSSQENRLCLGYDRGQGRIEPLKTERCGLKAVSVLLFRALLKLFLILAMNEASHAM
jgi:hypothetical protein